MPISVDSQAWEEGESEARVHNQLLEFLRENSDKAYRYREISDEVLDTNWMEIEEKERLRQELTEEEFNRRLHNDELPDASAIEATTAQSVLDIALSKLSDLDMIEERTVDPDEFDVPHDWDFIKVFTYSGAD